MSGWTAVALSRDVPAGATRAIVLNGAELVAWRGEDGAIHLWEDRCPHRGMRLSFGFVRGDSLNCLYHGWQYGSGSQCIRIPAHPDLNVPPSIKARALAVSERGGFIWTGGDGDGPVPPEVPDTKPLASMVVWAGESAVRARFGDGPVAQLDTPDGAVLHVAWHLVRPGKVMLHALIEPGPDYELAANWLRGVRSALEGELAA